ncbi:MAG: hypothetical protein ABEN55_21560, partial [Bradymonadaceae bacterium]
MPPTETTTHPRWPPLAVACLAALLCLQVGCRSEPSTTEESTDELVGSPVRPGSGSTDNQQSDPEPTSVRRGALWYRMVIERKTLSVTIRLLHPADRTSFFLPGSMASNTGARRAFTMGGARGPNGSLPVEQYPDDGRLDVATEDLAWVELDYRIALDA